jgi:ubiquinone/menaquinone biosynthesis C-methylase UbiE
VLYFDHRIIILEDRMQSGEHEHGLIQHVEEIPGGAAMVEALISLLDLKNGLKVLDLGPGSGAIAALLAKQFKVHVTVLVSDPSGVASIQTMAQYFKIGDLIDVAVGTPASMQLESAQFDRMYSLAHPFPIPSAPGVIAEIHRVLKSNGLCCLAGPASMLNVTPDYMSGALVDYIGVTFRSPAWTALSFAREGFQIVRAEYLPGAYDKWTEWISNTSSANFSKAFITAVGKDKGRWLSLGIIALRKPPKPDWAV